ncbi:MAG: AgmX/PglI C-terminal domain-containing protein [Myxococcota bacterium]
MPRLSLLLGTLLLVLACESDQKAQRKDEKLPPLRPPAENLFCAVGGDDGVGMPPKPTTPEQLSKEEVDQVWVPRSKVLLECYEDRVRRGYAIKGHVGLRFFVNEKGFVQQMCLVEDETGDSELINCIFGEVGTWKFPERPARTEVRRRLTFKLPK